MLLKKSKVNYSNIEILSNPKFEKGDFDFIRSVPLKLASTVDLEAQTNKDGNSPEFDLEAEIKEHPDSLYVKCFAIKANETNDNGDWFSTEELKKAAHTFVGVPVFTNHQNNDIEKAKGKVVHAWYDDEKDGIMVIQRIDAVAYPHIARGVKEKYMAGTSMGTQVQYSLCSVCHNYASKPDQYCGCVKERKGKHITGKHECIYKKNGTEEKCPLCGCGKNEKKINEIDTDVHEKNFGLKFIENSLVVNPACHDCGITEVIDVSNFLKKVAYLNEVLPNLLKNASSFPMMCSDQSCVSLLNENDSKIFTSALENITKIAKNIENTEKAENLNIKVANINIDSLKKYAGEQEIKDLKQALDLISGVAKKMIDQRAQVDMEFLTELTECITQLQQTTVELEQMGYGRLVSPESPSPELGPGGQPPGTPVETTPLPVGAPPGSPSQIQSGSAGQVGTVTSPMSASVNLKLPLKLSTNSCGLMKSASTINDELDLSKAMKNAGMKEKRLDLAKSMAEGLSSMAAGLSNISKVVSDTIGQIKDSEKNEINLNGDNNEIVVIKGSDRYGSDTQSIGVSKTFNNNGVSVALQVKNERDGVLSYSNYWHYKDGEDNDIEKTFSRLKRIASDIRDDVEGNHLPISVVAPMLRSSTQYIDLNHQEDRDGLPLAKYDSEQPKSPSWEKNLYGNRYDKNMNSPKTYGKRIKDSGEGRSKQQKYE